MEYVYTLDNIGGGLVQRGGHLDPNHEKYIYPLNILQTTRWNFDIQNEGDMPPQPRTIIHKGVVTCTTCEGLVSQGTWNI